jgi:hypothetical protein
MLAEAAQELAGGERHDALLVTVRVVLPSEIDRGMSNTCTIGATL